jgi:hypothetical protein
MNINGGTARREAVRASGGEGVKTPTYPYPFFTPNIFLRTTAKTAGVRQTTIFISSHLSSLIFSLTIVCAHLRYRSSGSRVGKNIKKDGKKSQKALAIREKMWYTT